MLSRIFDTPLNLQNVKFGMSRWDVTAGHAETVVIGKTFQKVNPNMAWLSGYGSTWRVCDTNGCQQAHLVLKGDDDPLFTELFTNKPYTKGCLWSVFTSVQIQSNPIQSSPTPIHHLIRAAHLRRYHPRGSDHALSDRYHEPITYSSPFPHASLQLGKPSRKLPQTIFSHHFPVDFSQHQSVNACGLQSTPLHSAGFSPLHPNPAPLTPKGAVPEVVGPLTPVSPSG